MAQQAPISEISISLPFAISQYGRVAVSNTQSKIWSDRVRGVLGTVVGERVMRPRFGSKIAYQNFENEQSAQEKLKGAIHDAFANFLPALSLEKVNTSFDDQENLLSVEVVYSLPNQDTVTTNIGVVITPGNRPSSEELL